MSIVQAGPVLRDLGAVFGAGSVAGLSDAQLLERYRGRRGGDTAAERAFEALVVRHGPMVLAVCRSLLRDPHDADDAFQATFLVLVRRAGELWVDGSLGGWLSSVAYRVSLRARADARRRSSRERLADVEPACNPPAFDDSAAVLQEELRRLPERFRVALVLCALEGRTHEEAARELRWPVGTVRSRLARGRDRLRDRLVRRGLAPAGAAVAVASVQAAPVPTPLHQATLRVAAMATTRGAAAAGKVSAAVLALTEGVIRAMFLTKLKLAAAVVLTIGLAASGARGLSRQQTGHGQDPDSSATVPAPAPAPAPGAGSTRQDSATPAPRADDRPSPQPAPAADPRAATEPVAVPATGASPRELEIHLRLAREKNQWAGRMFRKGMLANGQYSEIRGAVDLLIAQIESLKEDLEDQIELLQVQLLAKDAAIEGVHIRLKSATIEMERARKLHESGAAPEGEVLDLMSKMDSLKADLPARQADRQELVIRLKQAQRKLKRLATLDTRPAE
jgi:RNA polymerase sigma-70 factor (ECF subfamily)